MLIKFVNLRHVESAEQCPVNSTLPWRVTKINSAQNIAVPMTGVYLNEPQSQLQKAKFQQRS
jgi:hypothetical protein